MLDKNLVMDQMQHLQAVMRLPGKPVQVIDEMSDGLFDSARNTHRIQQWNNPDVYE